MDRSPMTMPRATPHDQLDRAPQSLTKREVQAHDGSDWREERHTMLDDLDRDEPGESCRHRRLKDRHDSVSPTSQSACELLAKA
jgi:hypothetical protein